jgi:hypothetical protein
MLVRKGVPQHSMAVDGAETIIALADRHRETASMTSSIRCAWPRTQWASLSSEQIEKQDKAFCADERQQRHDGARSQSKPRPELAQYLDEELITVVRFQAVKQRGLNHEHEDAKQARGC